MDFNIVVLAGCLAAPAEERILDSGSRLVRCLVMVRTEKPKRRVDVIPVTWWEPPEDARLADLVKDQWVWVVGSLQRRYWTGPEGRRSRIEVVAHRIDTRLPEDEMAK